MTLSGHVPDELVRGRLVAALRMGASGAAVTDHLAAASGEPPDFEGAALFIIEQVHRLNPARASLRDRVLSIEGAAPDATVYRSLVAAWRERLPAGFVAGTVSVTAPLVSPYRLTIKVAGEAVAISGHLPDETARDAMLVAPARPIPVLRLRIGSASALERLRALRMRRHWPQGSHHGCGQERSR